MVFGSIFVYSYIGRYAVENGELQNVFSIRGKNHHWYKAYAQLYYLLLLLFMIISGVSALKKEEQEEITSIGKIILVSFFFFLTVWESNPRYLTNFIPIIIIVSTSGIVSCMDWIENRAKRKWLL